MSRGAIGALVAGMVGVALSSVFLQLAFSHGRWIVPVAVLLGFGIMLASAWVTDELRERRTGSRIPR